MTNSTDIAVRFEGLGKRYCIARRRARYRTLRESITEAAAMPLRRLRGERHVGGDRTLWALRDVSLEIRRGDVVGIVGANGAGKTTLLKVLSRITQPTEGRVLLRGRIGSLLEVGTGFHPELTGRENVFLNGAILGMRRAEIKSKFDEIVAFAEVEDFIDTPIKRYSSGMATRLAFAVAAHLEPEIMAVDEVLSVGDLAFRKKSLGKMGEISRQGRTVLFVSHEMNAVRRLCNTGVWLDHGRVRALGDVGDVVRQYEEFVLGDDAGHGARVERPDPPASERHFAWASLARADAQPATTFRHGDSLLLSAGMGGRTPHSTHFVEWFLDDTARGNRVAWGATHALEGADVAGDAPELTFRIGPLPLTRGPYSISLAMGVPGVVDLDFWADAIRLEITECRPDQGAYAYNTRYAPTHIPYGVTNIRQEPNRED